MACRCAPIPEPTDPLSSPARAGIAAAPAGQFFGDHLLGVVAGKQASPQRRALQRTHAHVVGEADQCGLLLGAIAPGRRDGLMHHGRLGAGVANLGL